MNQTTTASNTITDNDVFCQKDHIVTRVIADETWLIPIAGELTELEQIYHLNEVGAYVWKLLDGITSLNRICEKVCDKYAVSIEQARIDIAEQVQDLLETGLIEEIGANG